MNEIKTVKIHCLSAALSPLTHMMGVQGNESVINRNKVLAGGQIWDVPVLSGNAIRHKMVREPGAQYIVDACALRGKLNVDQANFLFYGGSLTDSAISDNLAKIAAMQELLPLFRLLGGSLKNQVVSGSLLASMGTLVCDENREALEKLLPEELLIDLPELRSCEDYVSGWQYTRGDAGSMQNILENESPPAEQEKSTDKSNRMIYSGQHVIPGAVFYHNFILQNVSRLEVGALYAALNDWAAAGGVIGGQARVGHGRLDTAVYCADADFFGDGLDLGACAQEYRQYTEEKSEWIAMWLKETFPAGREKTAKKAKGSKAAGADGYVKQLTEDFEDELTARSESAVFEDVEA